MKIVLKPYEITQSTLLQNNIIINQSQLLFSQRLAHFKPILEQKMKLQNKDFLTDQETIRIASPSQSEQQNIKQSQLEQTLIGMVIAKYPNRKSAVHKFSGFLDLETQKSEFFNLEEKQLYLKCERFVVKISASTNLEPGMVLALRGKMNSATETFEVENEYFVKEISEICSINQNSEIKQNVAMFKSLQQNKQEYGAISMFLQQHDQIKTVVINQTMNLALENNQQYYSPTEAFLEQQYDFQQIGRQLSGIAKLVDQLVVVSAQGDAVNQSYPQQAFYQFLEGSYVHNVQFSQNPMFFEMYGKNCLLIDGFQFNLTYDKEIPLKSILNCIKAQHLLFMGGTIVDMLIQKEDIFYLDNKKIDVIVILGYKTNQHVDVKQSDGQSIQIIAIQEGKSCLVDDQLKCKFLEL